MYGFNCISLDTHEQVAGPAAARIRIDAMSDYHQLLSAEAETVKVPLGVIINGFEYDFETANCRRF
jgi:hypothetical protein